MTKINRLVMHGFKSFAKRTELVFGKDFNCVLGPNGSGKSNIMDALCFVLGKSSAKALRSEKAANLIYNGGKSKKPASMAEVSIYFDNSNKTFPTDADEVKITRMVRKSGQSVYKINNESRTRQQILEMLSLSKIDPDAYNIILQGDIIRFCEMHPEERRKLIEEISGISIYEEKKQKAINELQRVDERLKEAEIILTERKTHLKELQNEKEQAEKFKDLNEKIKVNKASLIYRQIERREDEVRGFEERNEKNRSALEEKQKNITEIKESIKRQKQRIDEINKEIETKGEKEQVAMHKDIENLRVDISTTKQRVESIKNEISKIKQRKSQLQQNNADILSKVDKLESEKKDMQKQIENRENELKLIEKKIGEFRKKHNLDNITDIEKEVDEIDKVAEEKQKEIQDLRQKQQEALRENDRLEFQIQGIDEKITKVLEVQKENQVQLRELKQKQEEFKKTSSELSQRVNDDASLAAQLQNAQAVMLSAKEELAKLEAKNMTVQEKLGENSATKKILDLKKKMPGIYGTVSELGKVSSKYALALEIAAGPKTTSIVVQDDKVAAECIKYLKDNKLGIATFLPLNKIKPAEKAITNDILSANGVEGMAIDLVSYDARFKNVFSYVFGNTVVVQNIDVARRIGIGSAKMVTLEGDLAEVSGAIQGGFRRKGSTGLGFSEKELAQDIKVCEKKIMDNEALLVRLQKDRTSNEEKIGMLRVLKANLEGDIVKLEKLLNIDSEDTNASKSQKKDFEELLKKKEKEIDGIADSISECNKELANNKIKRQQLREKINQLRTPSLLAELNAFEEKKSQLREELVAKQGEIKSIEAQTENVFGPEVANIKKIMKQHDKEEDDFKEEIELLKKDTENKSVDLKEKEAKQKEFQQQFKGLFAEKGKIDDGIRKEEGRLEEFADKSREIENKVNIVNLEAAKIKAELAGFREEFREYEGLEVIKNKSEQELRKQIGIYDGVVTKIGNVNMKALEIYDNVVQEYENLNKKKEKLVLEKEDVLIMMNEVELKKKDMFMKSFDIVNGQFKTIFSALSTKGEASLVLENQDVPFEGGLLIKVRLSGSKFMDIRSLSGGEKTMTALAFIFAIQEHEPASFYVLDEVDAALDKKNSEKLAQLVKKYSENAQYLMISHNDGVISEANVLYGVSMDEHGQSNVVSLKI